MGASRYYCRVNRSQSIVAEPNRFKSFFFEQSLWVTIARQHATTSMSGERDNITILHGHPGKHTTHHKNAAMSSCWEGRPPPWRPPVNQDLEIQPRAVTLRILAVRQLNQIHLFRRATTHKCVLALNLCVSFRFWPLGWSRAPPGGSWKRPFPPTERQKQIAIDLLHWLDSTDLLSLPEISFQHLSVSCSR